MKDMKYIITGALACLLLGGAAGFMAGRKTITAVTKTEIMQGEPLSGTVRADTFHIPVDTLAIVADYLLRHPYTVQLFDNQYGKLDVSLATQYNRLSELSYSFYPLYTVKTVERKSVWIPFASAGYNSLGYVGVGGGIFYNNWGFNLQYATDLNRKGFGFGLMYKF